MLYHDNEENADDEESWKREIKEKQAEKMFFEKFLIKLYQFNTSSVNQAS